MLELSEIQGLVTSGFAHSTHASFIFLQVENSGLVKTWLDKISPFIDTSARRSKGAPKPPAFVQIGFTASGLGILGLPSSCLNTFPREFSLGMADSGRSKVLGDTGESAPEHWQVGGTATPDVHILVMLYAVSSAKLEQVKSSYLADAKANGLKEIFRQDSHKTSPFEPFGFRDGISQPVIEGVSGPDIAGQSVVKAGEFLLGYVNEYGQEPAMPTVPASLDIGNVLPSTGAAKAFGRNGTFLVFRKLAQDVSGFWKFIEDQSREPDGTVDPDKKELLAAKLVGRWRSGTPLTASPKNDDPKLGEDAHRNNDFLYMPTDADGFGCPLGAHIRRSNPRDSQQPNPTRSLAISNRHRILRRGRPFKDAHEEGILFIALNTDIQRQFEFIQQTWINNEKFNGLYDNKDPLVGNQNDMASGTGTMSIQGCPVRHKVQGIPRFTQVRGGLYCFVPSISAIKFLSKLP